MKRWILLFLLLAALIIHASASRALIRDTADLLSESEEAKLTELAQNILDAYDTDITVLTVASLDGQSPEAFAGTYFDAADMGLGGTNSGVLILVSMEYRDWYILTNGDACERLSRSELDDMEDAMLSSLSQGEYYDAFAGALTALEHALSTDQDGLGLPVCLLIGLGSGALIAAVVLYVMRRKMNTVRAQRGARSYMADGSYDLYRCRDLFLYSHITKIRRQQSSSSGGRNRSGDRNRSGGSRGGRGGKF